jgi:mono/diheme cytochrome c family protein
MFKTYCASCHGVDGKGHGPAAESLKIPPADLTVLSQKNGGKFPSGKVSRVIEGADVIPAHGSSDMPTWGVIFHSLDPGNASLTKLRIVNLVKYIESMQK